MVGTPTAEQLNDVKQDVIQWSAKSNRVNLVDENGDIINILPVSIETSEYGCNEVYENGTDTYICKEDKDGKWYILKIDTNSVFTYATVLNNSSITTYANARTNILTLTYNIYEVAF